MSQPLSSKLPWDLMNPKLAAAVNPLLANPLAQGQMLQNVAVKSGWNTVNHLLGRRLQGYFVIMNSAPVTYFDAQQSNQMADKTLILHASGDATLSLYVF